MFLMTLMALQAMFVKPEITDIKPKGVGICCRSKMLLTDQNKKMFQIQYPSFIVHQTSIETRVILMHNK